MTENREICGLSIASLVTGIIGIFPAAIICGHISLRNIRKNNRTGKGLAIAGMILGYLSLAGMTLMLILTALFLSMQPVDKTPSIVIEMTEDEAAYIEIEDEANVEIKK